MSFFKKIGRSVSSAFKKAPSVVSSFFKKTVPNIAGKVGSGLGKVGDVLGKVADVGGSILSNPLVDMGASAILGPEAGLALGAAGQGLKYLKQGSNIAKGGSQLAGIIGQGSGALGRGDIGGTISNIQRGIQKAKDLRDQAGVAGPNVQFA
jgi:hypothetical protein